MATKIFLVIKKDIVEQSTGYFVRAVDSDEATALVNNGIYIDETDTIVEDVINSETIKAVEIDPNGTGQEVNEG